MDDSGRKLLGQQLKVLRESSGLTHKQLAEKLQCSRAWIYDVEEGRKNFTIDEYERLLHGCNASVESAMRGLNTSDIPAEFHDLYWMLRAIINSGNGKLVDGIRVNLEAISEKAMREHSPPSSRKPRRASST